MKYVLTESEDWKKTQKKGEIVRLRKKMGSQEDNQKKEKKGREKGKVGYRETCSYIAINYFKILRDIGFWDGANFTILFIHLKLSDIFVVHYSFAFLFVIPILESKPFVNNSEQAAVV